MKAQKVKTASLKKTSHAGVRVLDAAESRERILQAALQEFASFGFAGSRMESIAKKAKANKAMLHYYFGSKENLYKIILERIFGGNDGEDEFVKTIEKADLTLAQKIHLFVYILINRHCCKNSETIHKIMSWEMADGRTHLKKMAKEYMIPRIMILEQLIEKGNKEKVFQCENPILAVWSLISQVAFYFIQAPTYEGTEIYDRLYTRISENEFMHFILRNFYRAISPAGKPVAMTSLPDNVINAAEKYLSQFRRL